METTYAFLKHGSPSAIVLVALLISWVDLNGDIQEIREDMVESDRMIRAEMNAGFQAIRAEMVNGDQATRAEMNAGFQSIRAELADTNERLADTNERLARVETRLAGVERVLYAEPDSP
ncbi:MAG: hypothetical protein F4133_12325 [Gammaproteobacteria bacterium]|nr:hypothetical protein [Gammaproteobacteria bacterium]